MAQQSLSCFYVCPSVHQKRRKRAPEVVKAEPLPLWKSDPDFYRCWTDFGCGHHAGPRRSLPFSLNGQQLRSNRQHLITDWMIRRSRIGAICTVLLPLMPLSMLAQSSEYSLFQHPSSLVQKETVSHGASASSLATILGTVTDINGQPVEGAPV